MRFKDINLIYFAVILALSPAALLADVSASLSVNSQKAGGSTVDFVPPVHWDLSDCSAIAIDATNPGSESARVTIRVIGTHGSSINQPVCVAHVMAAAEKTTHIVIDLSAQTPTLPGVTGTVYEPGPTVHSTFSTSGSAKFDRVESINLTIDPSSPATTLYFDHICALPVGTSFAPPSDISGIADKYGQFAWDDWPGKLHSDADFTERKAAETKDLKSSPVPADRDRFGGWANGPTLEHSKYFTTAKYDGKWTLVDPDGHLFLSLGIDCVAPASPTVITGRENLFAWLPSQSDPLAATVTSVITKSGAKETHVDLLKANLMRKFRVNWLDDWRSEAQRRLPSWGFNTIGNWSHSGFYSHSRVPYVATISIGGNHVKIDGLIHDPWDPQFEIDTESAVRATTAKVEGDPWCIGYFVDNELTWGWNGSLATSALHMDAVSSATKRAFIAILQAKYPSIDALNSAWGTNIDSWATLGKPYTPPASSANAMAADMSAFRTAHAEKYFTVVRDALKANDPDHLYLGCRFASSSPEAVAACSKICDVVSFNVYMRRINTSQWNDWLRGVDKPVLIGEFHFGALDRGLFRVGMQGATDQAQRAQCFREYVGDVIKDPHFVGCHWFCYYDEPLLGRFDGENFNIGFVDVTDTPYPEMVAAARQALAHPYSERWKTDPQ